MADAATNTSASFGRSSDEASSAAERAKQAAEEAFSDGKARAAEYLELGRDKALAMSEVLEAQIRTRPLGAMAVAAGVGLALGFLWTRRK